MGMNYYLVTDACSHCGRGGPDRLHIGKSSAGWCFSLRVHPDHGINSLDDWRMRWGADGVMIQDEHGDTVTPAEMDQRITDRRWNLYEGNKQKFMGYSDEAHFHAMNHSECGPNGLLRHVVDGRHCIGHGEGTWDLIVGEFS